MVIFVQAPCQVREHEIKARLAAGLF